jgi:hypothetical protein
MKFVKRAPITRNAPMSDRFAVLPNDRIVTNTKVSLGVPVGQTPDRPTINENGMVRYNTDLQEFEVYNSSGDGLGWELVRTVRPAPITVQTLGPGNYATVSFGPLRYASGEYYTNYTNPQNILVFIENVYQIPVTNYTLIQDASYVRILFSEPPPSKSITVLLGYDGYFPPFPNV